MQEERARGKHFGIDCLGCLKVGFLQATLGPVMTVNTILGEMDDRILKQAKRDGFSSACSSPETIPTENGHVRNHYDLDVQTQ